MTASCARSTENLAEAINHRVAMDLRIIVNLRFVHNTPSTRQANKNPAQEGPDLQTRMEVLPVLLRHYECGAARSE